MSQQAMTNPVDLYEAAVRQTRKVIAGVKPDQLSHSTPCTQWNVQALLDHLTAAPGVISAFLAGGFSLTEGAPQQAPGTKDALAAYDAATASTLKAARAPGFLEKRGKSPIGEISGTELMWAIFMDVFIHGWDLAKATGQNTRLDKGLAEACYGHWAPLFDLGRASGSFGPAIPAPENADIQTKLLGASGRKA